MASSDTPRATSATRSSSALFTREKPKRIADILRREIIDRRLEEGHSLGTEADLVDRFEVSRPTLREALRILETEGLISVLRGMLGGVTVREPNRRMTARTAALVLQSRSVDLADVFDASAIIEPAAARVVAESRAHVRAAKELRSIIADEKRAISDIPAFTNAQIRFHEEIVILSGNSTLTLVMEMLNEVIDRAVAHVLSRPRPEVSARRSSIRSHEQLAELIEGGDGDSAQAHWSSHMARLRKALLGERGSSVVDLAHHL